MDSSNYVDIIKNNQKDLDELLADINNIVISDEFSYKFSMDSYNRILKSFALLNNLYAIQSVYDDIAIEIDKEFQLITIKCKKYCELEQYMILKPLPNDHYTVCEHSLPELYELQSEYAEINLAVDMFKGCLSDLSEYFDTMADIDRCCWIIDPKIPTAKDNYRRIVIDDNISLMVTVDSTNSRSMPQISVLGPKASIESVYNKIHQYTDTWNSDLNVTINILNMLGLDEFPTKPLTDSCKLEQQTDMECCICFSVRDDTESLPTIVCDNYQCAQKFHAGCLYQCLSAVSTNVQTFNMIHGECPNCQAAISCAVMEVN